MEKIGPFSAKDLMAMEKSKQNVKKETYKAILDQMCRKIKTSYDLGKKDTIVTIPPFVIGFPRYDIAKAVQYTARQLMKLGYIVEYAGPMSLAIHWAKTSETVEAQEEEHPVDILPGLVNLQKTARRLRGK
jgi:hypothetical protein